MQKMETIFFDCGGLFYHGLDEGYTKEEFHQFKLVYKGGHKHGKKRHQKDKF